MYKSAESITECNLEFDLASLSHQLNCLSIIVVGRDVAFHMRKLAIQIVNLSLLLLVMTLTECASLSPYLIPSSRRVNGDGQNRYIYIYILYEHQWNTRWAFARKHDIFTRENNMLFSHVKISPLLWLHNKSRLSQDKTFSVKWFGISVVFIW